LSSLAYACVLIIKIIPQILVSYLQLELSQMPGIEASFGNGRAIYTSQTIAAIAVAGLCRDMSADEPQPTVESQRSLSLGPEGLPVGY
jgi:hypothetical protein